MAPYETLLVLICDIVCDAMRCVALRCAALWCGVAALWHVACGMWHCGTVALWHTSIISTRSTSTEHSTSVEQ